MTDKTYKKALKSIKMTDKYNSKVSKAYEELVSIGGLDSDGFFEGTQARQRALRLWWSKWVMEVVSEQSVLNEKYLGSEYKDILKTKLAENCAEEITEECINYKTEQRKITATFMAIRKVKGE